MLPYWDTYYTELALEHQAKHPRPDWAERVDRPVVTPRVFGWVAIASLLSMGLVTLIQFLR